MIVFKASPDIKRPIKFEPFGPGAYQLRGNCVTDFPRTGDYYFAIWAKDGSKGIHHYGLGIGLAERDVMKVTTTLFFDYMIVKLYMFNHWSFMGIMWPVLVLFLLAQAGLVFMLLSKTVKSPNAFQWLTITAASIICGNAVLIFIQLMYAASTANYWGGEIWVMLIKGIGLPLTSAITILVIAFKCNVGYSTITSFKRCCCCCKLLPEPLYYNINRRVVVIILGLVHLFMINSGFIVAPLMLIIAGALPAEKFEG